jgi:predicted RNA-binding Zn-ribbon protein involved in translation (DUF1610 family)
MLRSGLLLKTRFSGITIGGSGGGQPLPLVILTVAVLAMAIVTVIDAGFGNSSGLDLNSEVPFKCTSCGHVERYTIKQLQSMQKAGAGGPMMGPLILDCPKCKKKALTQAVECLKCKEVYIMDMDPMKGKFNDKCPKCGSSFSQLWREKYAKEQGQ